MDDIYVYCPLDSPIHICSSLYVGELLIVLVLLIGNLIAAGILRSGESGMPGSKVGEV